MYWRKIEPGSPWWEHGDWPSELRHGLRTEINLNYIYFSYHPVNKHRLVYKNSQANVWGIKYMLSEPYQIMNALFGRNVEFLNVKTDCVWRNYQILSIFYVWLHQTASQPAEKRCYPVDGTCVNKSERRLASAGSFRFYLRLFSLCRIVGDKILCAVVLKAMLWCQCRCSVKSVLVSTCCLKEMQRERKEAEFCVVFASVIVRKRGPAYVAGNPLDSWAVSKILLSVQSLNTGVNSTD